MCGIAGAVAVAADARGLAQPLQVTAERMSDRITHRGPDGSGVWASATGNVALAHRRLAIVELSDLGRQPMTYADGRYCITFNGEIYNFRELSAELTALGHRFRGHSDTEVILAAVAQWGLEPALRRLVGMFAFALWDESEQLLHLARDRMGEKPLLLTQVAGVVYFASELRAFHAIPGFSASVSAKATATYLRVGYVPGTVAMYEGVCKLAPGCTLTLSATRQWTMDALLSRQVPYWNCSEVALQGRSSLIVDRQAAAAEVERLLRQAMREQMQADVPVGAFLSGGIDSTLVATLMQQESAAPIHTFTVAFDDPRFDESVYARAIAERLGTRHEQFVLNMDAVAARIPQLVSALDEPTANGSFFAVYMISELARTRVKVILSGDGGDELFAGYNRYDLARRAWSSVRWMPPAMRSKIVALIARQSPERVDRYARGLLRWMPFGAQVGMWPALLKLKMVLESDSLAASYDRLTSCWDYEALLSIGEQLPARAWSEALDDDLSRMLLADQLEYLPGDSLAKVDRASMGVSLETRLPLLDYRLVELSWRLSNELKLDHGVTKSILREVLYRHIPREMLERKKMGFTAPLDVWLRGPLKQWAEDLLNTASFRESLPFKSGVLQRAWQDYLARRSPSAYQMWGLVMLSAWMGEVRQRSSGQ